MRKDRHKKSHHRPHKGGDGKKSTAKSDHRETSRKDTSQPRLVVGSHEQALKVENAKPGFNSSKDNAETTTHSAFSRRKVESNWDRYQELPDDEDKPEVRGADFNTLLIQAGAASSQFRLHDEKDWEEDTERFQLTGDVMSIDINALSVALMQLPLHTRLQIEPEIFQVGDQQVEEEPKFDQTTVQGKSSTSRTSPPQPPASTTREISEKIKGSVPQSDQLRDSFRQDSEKVPAIPKSAELDERQKEQLKAEISGAVKSDTAVHVKETATKDVESDEDELEFLLSLDTPQSVQSSSQQTDIQPSPPEDQEQQISTETKESTQGKVPEKTINEPTSDELEDWLDSVLDD